MIPLIERPLERLAGWLREPRLPRAGFALGRGRLVGAALAAKEPRLAGHVLAPLPDGILEPSFDRPNLPRPALLEERVRDASRRLGIGSADILLLPPEACFKAYVLAFDEFPAGAVEREALLSHRLDKLLPTRPDDIRMSYDVRPAGDKVRVFLTLARAAVIEEYEKVFDHCGLRPRAVTLPSLGLLGCVSGPPDRTLLAADIDDESIGLLALAGSEIVLYRSKPFLRGPGGGPDPAEARLEQAAVEIANTLHFLEDHEGLHNETVHVLSRLAPAAGEVVEFLRQRLSVPVVPVACPAAAGGIAGPAERAALAPLLGHLS